ncbi:Crp/Fnr family transcriptional regulator [Pedobacter miscanthi]|uniref:Crp/Fnr family transcriptional regulator n=1 Tax=Pedobacter miscanthi TaxID=2259170 RepID=A0A366KXI8_9SPHI|nr:Crp/Fnr family transcriptional regulator [Pedobacter miscanthi]RBQ05804.1 Crp/Fnr family transcriptional regulator [Pedobacter miscanthi]
MELDFLRAHIHQIICLTDEEFEHAASFFTKRKYKKHQYIIQAGDAASMEHFVVKGIVKSSYTDNEGKEYILQLAMEEWWFSDPNAFNTGTPATLNVDCIEDTTTLSISFENKEKLCASSRKMEYFFRKKYTTGNMALQKRVLALLSNNAGERYKQWRNQYPSLQKRISKTLIASYLGVTRETLSRLSV